VPQLPCLSMGPEPRAPRRIALAGLPERAGAHPDRRSTAWPGRAPVPPGPWCTSSGLRIVRVNGFTNSFCVPAWTPFGRRRFNTGIAALVRRRGGMPPVAAASPSQGRANGLFLADHYDDNPAVLVDLNASDGTAGRDRAFHGGRKVALAERRWAARHQGLLRPGLTSPLRFPPVIVSAAIMAVLDEGDRGGASVLCQWPAAVFGVRSDMQFCADRSRIYYPPAGQCRRRLRRRSRTPPTRSGEAMSRRRRTASNAAFQFCAIGIGRRGARLLRHGSPALPRQGFLADTTSRGRGLEGLKWVERPVPG
jgi:hypothetical protein